MSLNDDAQIDTSQIEDRRGRGGGGLGGLSGIPIPTSKTGLIITGIIVLVTLIGGGFGANSLLGGGSDNGQDVSQCSSAHPDRLDDTDCRNALYVNSVQAFWQKELPQDFGKQYQRATTVFFSQAVSTGCGQADTNVGPFYCPEDHKVYIDLAFY